MDKKRIIQILEEIAVLLELKGENPFKTRAYANAARALQGMESDIGDALASGELEKTKGIGAALLEKIETLHTQGSLPYYDDLKAAVPAGLIEMVRIPNLGAKKIRALHQELGIDSIDRLEESARAGEIAGLSGFGKKSQEKILKGIEFLRHHAGRYRLDRATELADRIGALLAQKKEVQRWAIGGSFRRQRETVKDLDIVVSTSKPEPVMSAFVGMDGVSEVLAHGKTKSSVRVEDGMSIDLRAVTDSEFPAALLYFTGSKAHNVALRGRAQEMGYKLNEYGIYRGEKRVAAKDEAAVFAELGLDYIEPELREDTGEIEAAERHQLPNLVRLEDLRGVLHVHTDYSDGRNTLEEMVFSCRKLGFGYLGISDHSKTAAYAGGLTEARVEEQHREIDALNRDLDDFVVFKGIESDILADGSLDYPDNVLERFDFVVASVHSQFNLSEKEMTARIVRAIEHPATTILGHPTGRLLLARDPYAVDQRQILEAAAANGVIVEINAHPQRLDLDWIHCKLAKSLGVLVSVNPDAHATSGYEMLRYGIGVARRGWLTKGDVFNTRAAGEVAAHFEARRSRG